VAKDRKYTWLPFRQGVWVSLAGLGVARVDITSIMESRLGRQLEGYTTERLIFNAAIQHDGTGTRGQTIMGVINLPADTTISNVTPLGDPAADWQYWEEIFYTVHNVAQNVIDVRRDISISRRSPGRDRILWFYIEHSGVAGGFINVSGRCLISED